MTILRAVRDLAAFVLLTAAMGALLIVLTFAF